ncbi:hypothetical protein, partial [Avibacterium paragallinarum]|uniref:hypothetical protein n=1 Tax=Avibacterium paragallinarum TaxID=728 RepID=UPI0039885466
LNSWILLEDDTDKNNLKCIVKRMTFISIIKNEHSENSFLKGLFSDLLYAMYCIKENQERYFYFNLRSSIENFLRFALNKKNEDSTGVRNLFTEFEQINKEAKNKLNSEYAYCCNYVHNNHIANIEHTSFFIQCKTQSFCSLKMAISHFLNIINEIIKYLIIHLNMLVDGAFHRAKSQLKFLLGDKLHQKFTLHKS